MCSGCMPVPSGMFLRSIKPKVRCSGVRAISAITGIVDPSVFVIVSVVFESFFEVQLREIMQESKNIITGIFLFIL